MQKSSNVSIYCEQCCTCLAKALVCIGHHDFFLVLKFSSNAISVGFLLLMGVIDGAKSDSDVENFVSCCRWESMLFCIFKYRSDYEKST